MAPFTPAGDRARWQILYDLLRKTETGGIVAYADMGTALGLDPDADRHKIQMAMRRAAKEHLETDLRSVAPVPNHGYKVVETARKLELARQFQGKAVRSVRRGRDHVHYADLSGLDDATRAVFEAMAWKFAEQDEALHRLDVRTKRHERQLQAAITAHQETAQQLTNLQDRLTRLEADRET